MTVVAVVWSGVGNVDAIVVGREGQWKINNEEEKKNDERGGGGASSISVNFVLVRVFSCGWLPSLLSPRRTCVDLPSFLDRFLAAV